MAKIRIDGKEVKGDQVVAGVVTGGNIVQSGRGSQVVIGAVVGGDVIQSAGGDEDED